MSASAMEIGGTDPGKWITGTDGDDVILAGGGDDEAYDPAGNHTINGGEGMESIIVYEGVREEFTFTLNADRNYVITGPGQDGTGSAQRSRQCRNNCLQRQLNSACRDHP